MKELNRNKNGIAYPSIDQLLDKIDSKYKLVHVVSRVANDIEANRLEIEDSLSHTTIGKALEEIINGKVEIEFE